MHLKNFTPAQTLMITAPMGVSGQNLMKYSFLDLVYNGYLRVYRDWRLPHPRDSRERLYTFVARGDRFNSYVSRQHQDPFVNPFLADDYEYQVRTLVKKVFKENGKTHGFKSKVVYKEMQKAGYFHTSAGLKYINLFFLNGKGSELKRKFNSILKEADETLPEAATKNPEKAKKILNELGSNVLLLDSFNDELIEKLKPIFEEVGKTVSTSSGDYIDRSDVFEFVFYSFLDTLDYFDSSFDSFDTTFDFGDGGFGDFDAGGFDGGDFGDW